ncbi:MAG: TauD/TfdA dioxygenase family protein [Alphaproteobacteria bacterium]
MALTIQPISDGFAVVLTGIDLRDAHDPVILAEVLDALARFPVCVVRHEDPLSDDEHIAASRLLGPVEARPVLTVSDGGANRIPHYEIIDQSNLDETGAIYADQDRRLAFKRANRLWHTDMSFHSVRATYSLLSAHVLPEGGGPPTEFADMRAAYDALPEMTKQRLGGMVAEHSYWYSRVAGGGPEATPEELASRPPARHPLVHERHGRKALYLASHASHIVGLPAQEGRDLLDELMSLATRPEFVYAHDWRVGDVVIWDNLATMHRARPFDDRNHIRDVRRTTCQEAVSAPV